MPANKRITPLVVRGKASFAKILGEPVLNYDKSGKEWKIDLVISEDTVKEFQSVGVGDRVKRKENYVDGQPYVSFRQSELRKDGSENYPIKVVDILNKDWDQNKLIGNGSDVDVKFVVMDHGPGKKHGMYIRGVKVLKLVEYNPDTFTEIDEEDPFYAELKAAQEVQNAEDLNDEVPF